MTRYITETIALGTGGRADRPMPQGFNLINYQDLENLLTNPTNLPDFSTQNYLERLEALTDMALRLQYMPADVLPVTARSRAARLRFLLWSLPFRLRAAGRAADVLPSSAPIPYAPPGTPGVTLETDQRVLVYAREAREEWLGYLNAWEDDPWLATAGRHRLERELRWLTEAGPNTEWGGSVPLALVERKPDDAAGREADNAARREDHHRIAADVAEAHWLPRGSVLRSVWAFWPVRWRTWALLLVLTLPQLTTVTFFSFGQPDTARWIALAVTGIGLLAVVLLRPDRRDSLVLLRFPAAVGVGALLLLSLTPRWWLDPGGWRVGVGLACAALLYLMVESRLHGASRRAAIGRGLLLGGVGILYSVVVCLVMFGFVVPSMGEHGECLAGWWNHSPWQQLPWPTGIQAQCVEDLHAHTAAAPGRILVLMTGWSLAVGLAAQILWDDRPVTAPLGRLRRVRGGR
ncbi:MAG: hypothetical protein ACT4N7_23815 [Actinokineospora sp.]